MEQWQDVVITAWELLQIYEIQGQVYFFLIMNENPQLRMSKDYHVLTLT